MFGPLFFMIELEKLKHSLLSNVSEDEISKRLNDISNTFNIDRKKIEKMYSDEKNISSYAYFYLPTNMYKMKFLFDFLNDDILTYLKNSTIIDIGTGPGTYIFSLIELLGASGNQYIGVDTNKHMLKQAHKIQNNLYPNSNVQWTSSIPKFDNEECTLIFGNSANEMGHMKTLKLINETAAKLVIFIEPGTKDVFHEMKIIREKLISNGFSIDFPCPSSKSCPMSEDNWCHQMIKLSLPYDLERLGQKIKKDRTKMPAIIHVYRKRGKSECVDNEARVIRLEKKAKHALLWNICEASDESNVFHRIEIPKKGLSKKKMKELEAMSTGFSINFEVEKVISENLKRVKLLKVNGHEFND